MAAKAEAEAEEQRRKEMKEKVPVSSYLPSKTVNLDQITNLKIACWSVNFCLCTTQHMATRTPCMQLLLINII